MSVSTPLILFMNNLTFMTLLCLVVMTTILTVHTFIHRQILGRKLPISIIIQGLATIWFIIFVAEMYQANGFLWLERGWLPAFVTMVLLALCVYLFFPLIWKLWRRF